MPTCDPRDTILSVVVPVRHIFVLKKRSTKKACLPHVALARIRRSVNPAIIVIINTLPSTTPSAITVKLRLLVVPFAIAYLHHRKGYKRYIILHNNIQYSVVVDYTRHQTMYKYTYTPTNRIGFRFPILITTCRGGITTFIYYEINYTHVVSI